MSASLRKRPPDGRLLRYEKHNDGRWSENMWRVVAGYKFGNATLAAQYENAKSDSDYRDRAAYGIFGNYTMGAITLKANYLKAKDAKNSSDSGARQISLGADYALSKRTTVYALYAKVNNDNNAYFSMGIGGGTSDRIDVNDTVALAMMFPPSVSASSTPSNSMPGKPGLNEA